MSLCFVAADFFGTAVALYGSVGGLVDESVGWRDESA